MNRIDEVERFDFVIVGAGAGGGPLAANLSYAGFKVLLLEAGEEHDCLYYDIPVMQAHASEDENMSWNFFVHHYSSSNEQQQQRDTKFIKKRDGVLYPRGSTLGGSTAISALVTIYPHNSDWDQIAEITGDSSWNSSSMRHYFERLEKWSVPYSTKDPNFIPKTSNNGYSGKHEYSDDGWLKVSRADPKLASREPYFLEIINAIEETSRRNLNIPDDIPLPRDPNDWNIVSNRTEGMVFIPASIGNGTRNGARERITETKKKLPENLIVRVNSFVTKVLFDGQKKAIGVEYLKGRRLYGSNPQTMGNAGSSAEHRVLVNHEVILAGGAFNTPQLLKLSGIGPRSELERLGIPVIVDAPGVGENLQDRYEVSIVNELIENFSIFKNADLDIPNHDDDNGDHLYQEWKQERRGPYSTNGSLAGIIKRSSIASIEPDLFVFAIPLYFKGYYPNYSSESIKYRNMFSILVLKAHTINRAGQVLLRSTNPLEHPQIEFKYFEEGSDTAGIDLEGVVDYKLLI